MPNARDYISIPAIAGADLSTRQNCLVYYDPADSGKVKLATDPAAHLVVGALDNAPADDGHALIRIGPYFPVIAGEALEWGDRVQVGANGRVYKWTGGSARALGFIVPHATSNGGPMTFETVAAGQLVYLIGFTPLAAPIPPAIIIQATAEFDLGSIAAGESGVATATVAGAVAGDAVVLNTPASLDTGLGLDGARVSAANTVEIRATNASANPINANATNFVVTLIRPGTIPA